MEYALLVIGKMMDLYAVQIPVFLAFACLFTIVAMFQGLASSPGKVWWRNPGLFTDTCYVLIHTAAGSYFRMPALMLVVFFLSGTMSTAEINDYFANGRGPLSTLPFWVQVAIYVIGSDFLLYWIHRGFHRGALWRFHAIHHSAKEVDWTTSYRFHPVNIMMQQALVTVLMISLGIKPEVMAMVAPVDSVIAVWQHSNTKWTLGPLKYVLATPVFHRWHHTMQSEGGNMNFAPTFACWDWLFGTFYMPEGKLPQNFGVDDDDIAEGYFSQLLYPFHRPETVDSAAPPAAAMPTSVRD